MSSDPSMALYASRDLYGGAVAVALPKDLIDVSDLRQVPDHQEVFLSPTNLTSITFEINQYVEKQNDTAAMHFHFEDVIADSDRVAQKLDEPTKVTMSKPSLEAFPAYLLQGGILAPEIDEDAPSNLPVEWQQSPQMKEQLTQVLQLVIRMEKYETDLCFRIDLPMKEMLSQDAVKKEESFAKEVMERIVATLEVKDFGLFGTE